MNEEPNERVYFTRNMILPRQRKFSFENTATAPNEPFKTSIYKEFSSAGIIRNLYRIFMYTGTHLCPEGFSGLIKKI